MKETKKEICFECGQEVDQKVWLKHTQKKLKRMGLPALAKCLKIVNKQL